MTVVARQLGWYAAWLDMLIEQVYAAEAGRTGMDVSAFATSAGIERATRIVGVGAVLTVVANALHPWLRRFYGTYLVLATAGFIAVLALSVQRWS